MTKKRRTYEPRVFDGRIIKSDEIERIHKEVLKFERIEAVFDPMRELIEELWPELVHKLPPKRPQPVYEGSSLVWCRGLSLPQRNANPVPPTTKGSMTP
jgi:hypothetical protein